MFGMGTGVSLLPSSPHINYTTFNLILNLFSLRCECSARVLYEPDGLSS